MCSIEHHCTEVISLFRWPIHNFARKTILDDPMAYLESEDFTLFQSRLTFFLQFWPTDGKDSIYSNLLLLPRYLDNYSSVQLQFKFYLENAKGDRVNGRHCETFRFSRRQMKGCGIHINHKYLYQPKSKFVENDEETVIVCCEIMRSRLHPDFNGIHLGDPFRQDLWKAHKRYAGIVTFRTGEGSFKVDKTVLAAQSNKLFNLLGFNPAHEKCQSISCSEEAILLLENSNGCAEIEDIQQKQDDQEESVEILENEDKVIEINGVSLEAMHSFIRFLYVGMLEPKDAQYADQLFLLAQEYEMDNLKAECIGIISQDINRENSFQVLTMVFKHNLIDLKKRVLDYVSDDQSDGNFKQIMKTKDWKEFALQHEDLANDILENVFGRKHCFVDSPSTNSSNETDRESKRRRTSRHPKY